MNKCQCCVVTKNPLPFFLFSSPADSRFSPFFSLIFLFFQEPQNSNYDLSVTNTLMIPKRRMKKRASYWRREKRGEAIEKREKERKRKGGKENQFWARIEKFFPFQGETQTKFHSLKMWPLLLPLPPPSLFSIFFLFFWNALERI